MVEIPTPHWIKDGSDKWVINPAVLEAQKAAYYDQRPAYHKERKNFIGLYNPDGTIRLFTDMK